MNKSTGPYQVVNLTPERRAWLNTLDLSGPAHMMYGLLEVDVTAARRSIKEYRARTGEGLSFTAFLVSCLARAVDEDKTVQACLKGRKQMVVFDDVNVGLMVEHEASGKRRLMGHVVREANCKTLRQIHDEIRSVQTGPAPPGRGMPAWFRFGLLSPWPLSKLFKALLVMAGRRDPSIRASMAGTVAISSIGMFGKGQSSWGIAPTPHPLGLVVGSTTWKPAVVGGRVEPREILNLTVLFDHDVVDGAPAARFTRRLVELIESGHGLAAADGR